MKNRRIDIIGLMLVAFLIMPCSCAKGKPMQGIAVQTVPVKMRCNYQENPLGVESKKPQLSWQTSTTESNWLQSAYQIIISTSAENLTEQTADVWNSGKLPGNQSVAISYGGPEMKSRQRYYWKVRVWDTKDNPSEWSEMAFWETSMLNNSEWEATWIAHTDHSGIVAREDIRWVWLPGQDATDVPRKTVAWFKTTVLLDKLPIIAAMQTAVRGDYELYVNGRLVDCKFKTWQAFERQDILGYLIPECENTIEVKVMASRSASFHRESRKQLTGSYAVFAGILSIQDTKGNTTNYPTSGDFWMCRTGEEADWKPAEVVATLDDPTFGLDPGPLSHPASLLRKAFHMDKAVRSARLYVTALGSYTMYINGNRIGNNLFTPEFTNYNSRIVYQTYDVTAQLKKGENVVGSLLGDGWHGSPMGWHGENDLFNSLPNMLLAEVHVTYKDGTVQKILTDESWKASYSPVLKSEIYSGEHYDARLEQPGWNTVKFDDKQWESVIPMGQNYMLLSSQVNPPVSIVREVNPVEIRQAGDKRWIIDMGQNLVGWVKLAVKGDAGTVVTMRFSEVLSSPDSIYTVNLRNASAMDTYVLKGKGKEVYTPHFTFHGFRYIELTGYPGQLSQADLVAEVISSVDTPTGIIQTSSKLVNNMYSLGIWGQLGNFISVPTDCPQRDERLGYTGDGQVFWRTGAYNFDIAAFTHKWMNDIKDEQTEEGSFPNTAPAAPMYNRKNGSPGWEDAGVIVPWSSWMQYGDQIIIEENWSEMVKYMDYIERQSTGFKRPGGYLGDWLALDLTTQNPIISNSLWAMTAKMMSQMAKATGRTEEAQKYAVLQKNIITAFREEFISADGTIGSGSQTSYAISLFAGMVPEELKAQATEHLVQAIEARNWHLSTGFIGTPYLLFALSDNGRADVAYRLLLNETFPSWGYMIQNGATTWWEHWDSDKGDPTMNSFNHYAFGSVAEWLYRAMAGINTVPEAPGFKKILISPVFDWQMRLTHAKGEYDSVYGKIISEWRMLPAGRAILKVEIPANTTARVVLPQHVRFTAKAGESHQLTTARPDHSTWEIGSGSHEFTIELDHGKAVVESDSLIANDLKGVRAIQQFQLRDAIQSEEDAQNTLKLMQEAGYNGIELNGFMIKKMPFIVPLITKLAGMPIGNSGKLNWRELITNSGLKVVSVHEDLGSIQKDPQEMIREAKDFGARYMVITGMYKFDFSDEDAVIALANDLNEAGKALKEGGIELLYHNHNSEFRRVGSGKTGYQLLLEYTDPEYVNFELDCFWAIEAGCDVIELMNTMGARMKLFHITDRGPKAKGETGSIIDSDCAELGRGNVNLVGLIETARANGVETIILETHRNWIDNSPVKSFQISAEFLRKLPL